MQEFKIVPSQCSEQIDEEGVKTPASFKGGIVVRVPKFSERSEFRSIAIGVALEKDLKIQAIDSLPTLVRLIEKSKDFYISVDLEFLADGTKFKCFEEMDTDPRCEEIMREIAMSLSKGLVPGKN